MNQRRNRRVTMLLAAFLIGWSVTAEEPKRPEGAARPKPKASASVPDEATRPDIVKAVKAAAGKDCGCGACSAKGCDPCHGKNCYYCVAKALVATECGCGMCDAKGCQPCGPGCDVCKFHLAPVAEAAKGADAKKKEGGEAAP